MNVKIQNKDDLNASQVKLTVSWLKLFSEIIISVQTVVHVVSPGISHLRFYKKEGRKMRKNGLWPRNFKA